MKIFVTGGTGFIGKHLVRLLLENGHQVIAVGSRPAWCGSPHRNLQYISADTARPGIWQDSLKDIDAAVNLAGRTIFHLWTKKYRQQIYNSRILTTRNLADGLPDDKNITLISASAAGYYGDCGDAVLTETAPAGTDFLAHVCADWEKEALRAEKKHIRVALVRFGVVIGKNGGALEKMIPAFRLCLGGPVGNGLQWFPWIHIDDLLSGIVFLLNHPDIGGPVNFCAPGNVRQGEFAKQLGRLLSRPAFMPAPAFLLRTALGEFASALLSSQRVYPKKLTDNGFCFAYSDIGPAIAACIGKDK